MEASATETPLPQLVQQKVVTKLFRLKIELAFPDDVKTTDVNERLAKLGEDTLKLLETTCDALDSLCSPETSIGRSRVDHYGNFWRRKNLPTFPKVYDPMKQLVAGFDEKAADYRVEDELSVPKISDEEYSTLLSLYEECVIQANFDSSGRLHVELKRPAVNVRRPPVARLDTSKLSFIAQERAAVNIADGDLLTVEAIRKCPRLCRTLIIFLGHRSGGSAPSAAWTRAVSKMAGDSKAAPSTIKICYRGEGDGPTAPLAYFYINRSNINYTFYAQKAAHEPSFELPPWALCTSFDFVWHEDADVNAGPYAAQILTWARLAASVDHLGALYGYSDAEVRQILTDKVESGFYGKKTTVLDLLRSPNRPGDGDIITTSGQGGVPSVVLGVTREHRHAGLRTVWHKLGAKGLSVPVMASCIFLLMALLDHEDPLYLLNGILYRREEAVSEHKHVHDHLEDTGACTETIPCPVCSAAVICKTTANMKEAMCSEHYELYGGATRLDDSPLLGSVRSQLTKEHIAGESATVFATVVKDHSCTDLFHTIRVPIEDPTREGFEKTKSIVQNLAVEADMRFPLRLIKLVHFPGSKAPDAFEGGRIAETLSYRDYGTGLLSYDSYAAPRPLRASLDITYRLYANEGGDLAMGHHNERSNTTVMPAALNLLKFVSPPQSLPWFCMSRFLAAHLLPIEDKISSDLKVLAKEVQTAMDSVGDTLSEHTLLVPYTLSSIRQKVANRDTALGKRLFASYDKLNGFSSQLGLLWPMPVVPDTLQTSLESAKDDLLSMEDLTASPSDIFVQISDKEYWVAKHPQKFRMLLEEHKEDFDRLAAWAKAIPAVFKPTNNVVDNMQFYTIKWELFCWMWWWYIWPPGIWILIVAFFFWMAVFNIESLAILKGRCPYFGFLLELRPKDFRSITDCHLIHGLSVLNSKPKTGPFQPHEVDFKSMNLQVMSRAANYLYHCYAQSDVVIVDKLILAEGERLLGIWKPDFIAALNRDEVYTQHSRVVKDCKGVYGEKPLWYSQTDEAAPNTSMDVPEGHSMHPDSGLCRWT